MKTTKTIVTNIVSNVDESLTDISQLIDETICDDGKSPDEKDAIIMKAQHALNAITDAKKTLTNALIKYDLFYK